MKPNFLFLYLLFLSVIGCSKLDSSPIDAKVIDQGYLQHSNDSLYLEINNAKYFAVVIHTGEHHHRNNSFVQINPIKDLPVTCFTAKTFNNYQFILGHKDAQEIENAFKENYAVTIIFFCFLLIAGIFSLKDILFEKKQQKNIFIN